MNQSKIKKTITQHAIAERERLDVIQNNIENLIINSDNILKSIDNEIYETEIKIDEIKEDDNNNNKKTNLQNIQDKLINLKEELQTFIKKSKDLNTDILFLKDNSNEFTHTIEECNTNKELNNINNKSKTLLDNINKYSERLKELREDVKGVEKGEKHPVPLPGDKEEKEETTTKAKLLGKIPLKKEDETIQKRFGKNEPFKLHAVYNEVPENKENKNQNTEKSDISDEKFNKLIKHIHEAEGGFVDDPNDRGGRTNMGITQRTYDAYNKKHGIPTKDVKDITKKEADKIYYDEYWILSGAYKIKDKRLALMHFDSAVNHGVYQAKQFYEQSGGDYNKYFQIRKTFFTNLAKDRTQKGFYQGWINRINKIDTIDENKL